MLVKINKETNNQAKTKWSGDKWIENVKWNT